jgi:hypothetical protein
MICNIADSGMSAGVAVSDRHGNSLNKLAMNNNVTSSLGQSKTHRALTSACKFAVHQAEDPSALQLSGQVCLSGETGLDLSQVVSVLGMAVVADATDCAIALCEP